MRRNSSNLSRCAAATASVDASRAVDAVVGRGRGRRGRARRGSSASSGSAKPRGLVRSQARRHRRAGAARCARRPSPTAGRRGRCVPVRRTSPRARPSTSTTGFVIWRLPAVAARPCRRATTSRAHGELALAPRLVEEHDVEQTGAVVDRRASTIVRLRSRVRRRVDRLHLGVDRRLLADRELGDLGPLGAVVVAARVVLEQVEHGLDAHRRPGRRASLSPTALSSVTGRPPSSRSVRPRGQPSAATRRR